MKNILFSCLILLGGVVTDAMAACGGTNRIGGPGNFSPVLESFLLGWMACGQAVAPSTDRWQEEHRAGGVLWDYKQGPGDTVDPSKQVGTWYVDGPPGSELACYEYNNPPDNGPYCFSVFGNNNHTGTYSFCKDIIEEKAQVIFQPNGSGGCVSFP